MTVVAVVGAGKIGELLLSGLLRSGWPTDQLVATARRPERAADLSAKYGIRIVDNATAVAVADVIAIAVKPQDAGASMGGPRPAPQCPAGPFGDLALCRSAHVVLREMAARATPVVRVMTNTPALVDEAMTAIGRPARHRRPPGTRRRAVRAARPYDPGARGPAGRRYGAVRVRSGVLLLPGRSDDRRGHSARPAAPGRRRPHRADRDRVRDHAA